MLWLLSSKHTFYHPSIHPSIYLSIYLSIVMLCCHLSSRPLIGQLTEVRSWVMSISWCVCVCVCVLQQENSRSMINNSSSQSHYYHRLWQKLIDLTRGTQSMSGEFIITPKRKTWCLKKLHNQLYTHSLRCFINARLSVLECRLEKHVSCLQTPFVLLFHSH